MRAGVAVLGMLVLGPALLSGHAGITAFVVLSPGRPHAGDACQVSIVAMGPTGALAAPGQRLALVAEMSGHAMTPVRAELRPAVAKGRYVGELTFTMAGPWRVRLELADQGETMWADFDVQVGTDEDDAGEPRRYTLEMLDPVRTTVFPPVWVVVFAVGLTAAAEGTAAVFNARRRRRGAVSGSGRKSGS